jgi:hypothetical protein
MERSQFTLTDRKVEKAMGYLDGVNSDLATSWFHNSEVMVVFSDSLNEHVQIESLVGHVGAMNYTE